MQSKNIAKGLIVMTAAWSQGYAMEATRAETTCQRTIRANVCIDTKREAKAQGLETMVPVNFFDSSGWRSSDKAALKKVAFISLSALLGKKDGDQITVATRIETRRYLYQACLNIWCEQTERCDYTLLLTLAHRQYTRRLAEMRSGCFTAVHQEQSFGQALGAFCSDTSSEEDESSVGSAVSFPKNNYEPEDLGDTL